MADELIEQHVPSPPVPSSRASSLDPEGNLQAGSHKPPHPQEMDLSLRDKRATGRRSDPWWRKDPNYMTPQELAEFKDLLRDLTRLVLRQADALSYMQLDVGYMLFLKTRFRLKLLDGTAAPEWAIVSNLFTVAQAWNRKKSEETP
eukprot:s60_g49.t1